MGNLPLQLLTIFGAGECKDQTFLGLLPWYHYINLNSQCGFDANHQLILLGANSSILLIFLAVIDDLLRIIGLLAVIFVIYAGVKYILSMGEPGETSKALSTVINALSGLGISLVAITFVTFLGNQLGSGTGNRSSVLGLDLRPLPNPTGADSGAIIPTMLSIAFGVIGALSFLVIVIAAMQYTFSQGDPQATGRAKNTIVYALVGLVLAIAAQSFVSLALSRTP